MHSNESWFWRCGRAIVSVLSFAVDVVVAGVVIAGVTAVCAAVVTGAVIVGATAVAAITGAAQTVILPMATVLAISTVMVFAFIVALPTDEEETTNTKENAKVVKLFARTETGEWLPIKAA